MKIAIQYCCVFILIVIGVWLYQLAHTKAAVSPCKINLQILGEAKHSWVIKNHKSDNDAPTWDDLKQDLQAYEGQMWWTNGRPICPKGGIYTLGHAGEPVRCSVHGVGP
jgi:hypothetical protein